MPGGRTWRWEGLAVNTIHDLTLTPDRKRPDEGRH
jgi:hypothetical protein